MSRQSGQVTSFDVETETEGPLGLIFAAFRDESTAAEALDALKAAQPPRFAGILSAVVLRKDRRGRLHIKETADVGGTRGAVIGGVVGAVIGVIAGAPPVVPAAVGALIGGLASMLRESGFSSERFNRVGKDLQTGGSAILAVVEPASVDEVAESLMETGAGVFVEELDADIAVQLEAGHDVAFSALVAREGLDFGRMAATADGVEGGMLVADDVGATASQFMVTERGFAVRAIEVTDKGAVKRTAELVADDKQVVNDQN